MHTEVFGTVFSWALRMEACGYVFIGAYNVVVSCLCLLVYVFISVYNVVICSTAYKHLGVQLF